MNRDLKGIAVLMLLMAPLLVNIHQVQATPNYLQEFSQPGDVGTVDSTWTYLTENGVINTIQVFEYGQTRIAFDETTNSPLTGVLETDFFQSYALRAFVASGQLTTSSYSISFQQSLTCSLAVPDIGDNLVGVSEQAATNKLADVLPEQAGNLVTALYDIGDTVGLVKDADPYALAVGVVCEGGDLLENFAEGQLLSCQAYVNNLENYEAFQGQAQDLINCQSSAVHKLQQASYSPDVLAQYGETILANTGIAAENALGSVWCYAAQCQSVPKSFDQSTLNSITAEIASLQSMLPSLQDTNATAQAEANIQNVRIILKASEAQTAISDLQSNISIANSIASSHEGLGELGDAFYSPSINISKAMTELGTASSFLAEAKQLSSSYQFNSAISTAQQGVPFANNAYQNILTQQEVPKVLASWVYAIGALTVLAIVCFSVLYLRRG